MSDPSSFCPNPPRRGALVRTLQWRKYATSPHKAMTLTPDPSRGAAETLWVRLQVGGRQSCRVTAAPRLGSGADGSRFCGETAQKRGRERATTRGEGVWSNGVEANLCSARRSTQRPVRVYRGCLPGLAAPAQWEGLCLRCHLKGRERRRERACGTVDALLSWHVRVWSSVCSATRYASCGGARGQFEPSRRGSRAC